MHTDSTTQTTKVTSGYATESVGVVEVANELATNLDVVEGEVLQRGRLVVGQRGRVKPGAKVGMPSVNDPTVVMSAVDSRGARCAEVRLGMEKIPQSIHVCWATAGKL